MMKVRSIGYGAGQKNFEGFSNVLKIVQGQSTSSLKSDSVAVLETNVDDVSGEVLAHVIDKVMSSGAKDVSVIPTITKKGRPSHIISVICDSDYVNQLLDVLVSETGTLGVRIRTSDRFVVQRQILTMKIRARNQDFTIRCKVAKSGYDREQFKVEYEDIKKVSEKLALPFKQTEELIKEQVKKQLK
jgi:uncharacterized protein (DUF111 family)